MTRGKVLVVGGGIVGLSSALRLQQDGWRTTVVDPGSAAAASWGNAGHIALEQVEPLASPASVRSAFGRLFGLGGALDLPPGEMATWLPWSMRFLGAATPAGFARGRAALGAILAEAGPAWRRLVADAGIAELYAESGHVVVWGTDKAVKAGKAAWTRTDVGTTRVRDLELGVLDEIAGRLKARPAGGIRFEGSGRIHDLPALKAGLEGAFAAAGGVLRTARAVGLVVDKGRASVVLDGGGRLTPDQIVITAGARSGRLMAGAGHRVPLIAERGYHLHDPDSEWPGALAPLVFEDRSLIMNRFLDGVRCSSFVEFVRPETPPDPRKWARLRSHVAALGLPIGKGAREWMGARPTLPDYLPAIGRSRRASNLAYAFGHQHLGLTLAPVTGEAVAALLGGHEARVGLEAFDVERFG